MRQISRLLWLTIFVLVSLAAFGALPKSKTPSERSGARLDADSTRPYLKNVHFTLKDVKYVDKVNEVLSLNADEQALLARQGMAVSGRDGWRRFAEAYAWIYWKDLPVLVTTDSILHAVHQSYDDLLKDLETHLLIQHMDSFLKATHARVVEARHANSDRELDALYGDVDTYLDVAIALLNNRPGNAESQSYVSAARAAERVAHVGLFGAPRPIDFTLFKPRGHYAGREFAALPREERPDLQSYFRAMTWLAQIDFRFVESDPETSEPLLRPSAIASAAILRDAIDASRQRGHWTRIDKLLQSLVGRSDNVTLAGFDRLLKDASLSTPHAILHADRDKLLRQLTTHDYGQQHITGQVVLRHAANASGKPIPRPVSLMLLGQRFAIDSYVIGELVYDHLIRDGVPVKRALPSPLDALYALGNDRAATHLKDELATYRYDRELTAMRQQVDALGIDSDFWQAPIYNAWLSMIRGLNGATTDPRYPKAMRTEAWADKMLQTQMASWAQLRHDNILYVKQSVTTVYFSCQYPAGYVEPYPAFYKALREYAQAGRDALTGLDNTGLGQDSLFSRTNALQYFDRLITIAGRLRVLAEKELQLKEFTAEENAFLKSIMVQQKGADFAGCAGPIFEDQWNGWYSNLFYRKDENPAVIADVHTNPNNDPNSGLYPPRVLHAATGPVAPMFLIVDTDEGAALYVGPAFSYFEVVSTGSGDTAPTRLTDAEWRKRLEGKSYPPAPPWTASFRLPAGDPPSMLSLPSGVR